MKKKKNPANVFAGRNLKYFMECNNISENELAEKLCIEKDSLLRILNGTNSISGPYNSILLKDYDCDLNFIYGGIEKSDMLHCESSQIKEKIENGKDATQRQTLHKSVMRELRYLYDVLDLLGEEDG